MALLMESEPSTHLFVMLFDKPTSALDPEMVKEVLCQSAWNVDPLPMMGDADENLDHQEVVHVFLCRQTSCR